MARAVHLYVHGRGRGHATRCAAVGHRLEELGFEVQMFAGPDALDLLQAEFPTEAVASLPPRAGLQAARTLAKRLLAARASAQRPAAIVSDGDLPGVLLGRAMQIPTIAMGHGLTFACCAPPPGASRSAWRAESTKARVASGPAHWRVAVNFVPLHVVDRRARLARPSVSLPPRQPTNGRVVCYFRDEPHLSALRTMVESGMQPLLFGDEAIELPGVEVVPRNRSSFVQALVRAHAVVASAGSQLISECVALGVPFFGLYGARDHEQSLNITMLRSAGLGDGSAIDELQPATLRRWLHDVQRPIPTTSWAAPTVADVVGGLCEDLTRSG